MFSEGYEDIWMESKWTGLIGTYRRKKRNIIFIALQGRSKNQSFFSQGYLFYGVFSQCCGHPTGSVSLKELMAEIDQDGNGVISVDEDSLLMSL